MRTIKVSVVALLLAGLGACAVEGVGYDGDVGVGVGYVGDYYEPCCGGYGGWGRGYRVGPPRGGDRGPGRSAPSIPSHGRSGGGGHAGGGRGGGGGHR
jgi:squid-like protein/heterogeneous nuclear ribonucleoprotein A1/A3